MKVVIALSRRRLSIRDLAEAGAQPMVLGDNGPAIAFNSECYNLPDLRKELAARGRTYRGHSDTEVVLRAYAVWGFGRAQAL